MVLQCFHSQFPKSRSAQDACSGGGVRSQILLQTGKVDPGVTGGLRQQNMTDTSGGKRSARFSDV